MAAYQNPTLGGPGGAVQPGNTPVVQPGGAAVLPSAPPAVAGGQFTGPNNPFAPVPSTPGAMPPQAPPAPDGGVRTGRAMTASAGPADYQGVQGFADDAYAQARRNIDPMQEQQSRRMQQDLINKGIDPSSAQGMAMLDQQNRDFADQNNSASFESLQFGQGIQDQMFGQDLQNKQMVNQMTGTNIQGDIARAGNDLNRYGMDQQFALGQSSQDLQRQQGNQQYQLGMGQLDMNRQGQEFNQMMGMDSANFRNLEFNRQGNQYQDALTMSLMGQVPIPGVQPLNPSGIAGGMLQPQPGIF